jgi:hypothetical protein
MSLYGLPPPYFPQFNLVDQPSGYTVALFRYYVAHGAPAQLTINTSYPLIPVVPQRLIVIDGVLNLDNGGNPLKLPVLFDQSGDPLPAQNWPVVWPKSNFLSVLPLSSSGNPYTTAPWFQGFQVAAGTPTLETAECLYAQTKNENTELFARLSGPGIKFVPDPLIPAGLVARS